MEHINEQALESRLAREARYLHIAIPYDEDNGPELINFDDGLNTELQYEEEFVPPMFNHESRALEVTVDLVGRKVIGWNDEKGYIHMWAKVIDYGIYTLLDTEMKPLWQIRGYVPNALVPPYDRGFGDYLELTINPDGTLPDWKDAMDFSDFIEDGREPVPISQIIKSYDDSMNEYIIYTTEGHTIAPNENVEVENCQVLGCARGTTPEEAKANLLKDNPWITEAGFRRSEFIARQIVSE